MRADLGQPGIVGQGRRSNSENLCCRGDNTFGSVHPSICVFVYALPFEPVVRSRPMEIANDYYQSIGIVCLFNVSRVSSRSALISFVFSASMKQATNGSETSALNRLILLPTEQTLIRVYIWTPENGLTL